MSRGTQGERLAVLEAEADTRWEHISKSIDGIQRSLESMDKRLAEQEKRLAAYENKGRGVLIGVGIAGAGMGATLFGAIERLLGVFK